MQEANKVKKAAPPLREPMQSPSALLRLTFAMASATAGAISAADEHRRLSESPTCSTSGCFGFTCEHWLAEYPETYSCANLEAVHSCDCSGCDCDSCPASCFGATCDQWFSSSVLLSYFHFTTDVDTCDLLEDEYGCDCSGCACAFSPPPAPSTRANEVAECFDKKGASWCSKKLSKCGKDAIAAKCEQSCGICGTTACELEDKKGTEWCTKKAKNAKKLSKLCSSSKAKKCEATFSRPSGIIVRDHAQPRSAAALTADAA